MYLKIDEAILKRIQSITLTDYEANGELVPVENVDVIIVDLLLEVERLEEKYKDLKQDIEDNYKHIPVSEQIGVSERDFI